MIWCTIVLIIVNRTQSGLGSSNPYGSINWSEKKQGKITSNWGSATLRKNLINALNAIPVEAKKRIAKPKVRALVSSTLHFHKNVPMKKFKKEIIWKQPSHTNNYDGRNSLNNYIKINSRVQTKAIIDFRVERELAEDSSITKISKIEYQVRRHCLKKKKYIKNWGPSVIASGNLGHSKMFNTGNEKPYKIEMTEQSWNEERDTRSTSKTSNFNYNSKNLDKEVDSSFMIADIDLGDKKESQKNEKWVSEKMTTKVYKTLAGGFQRIFSKPKSYGCNWGSAIDPNLDWWRKAEVWLKYAFQDSAKAFSDKDKKVFKELSDMDVKKESKNSDNDDRIPLTGNQFYLIKSSLYWKWFKKNIPKR
jgi:hypothetical protein